MKKITYLSLLFVAILFAGCEKAVRTFDAPSTIEFKPAAVTVAKNGLTPVNQVILVQLVGPQQSTDITVTYTIDAANTTAVLGTNYTNSNTTGTLVIPANSSSASMTLTTIPGAVASSKKVTFVMTSAGSVPVSVNYGKSIVTMNL